MTRIHTDSSIVHGLLVIGPAPISRELSSIGAGSSLRYEIVESIMEIRLLAVPFDRLRTGYVSLLTPKGQSNIGVL